MNEAEYGWWIIILQRLRFSVNVLRTALLQAKGEFFQQKLIFASTVVYPDSSNQSTLAVIGSFFKHRCWYWYACYVSLTGTDFPFTKESRFPSILLLTLSHVNREAWHRDTHELMCFNISHLPIDYQYDLKCISGLVLSISLSTVRTDSSWVDKWISPSTRLWAIFASVWPWVLHAITFYIYIYLNKNVHTLNFKAID